MAASEEELKSILMRVKEESETPGFKLSIQKTKITAFGPISQFSHSVVSNFLGPHGLQHTRLPCPSPTPVACSNSCPSSQWCHPTSSSSVIPFSSCLQSFPASGSFQWVNWFSSVQLLSPVWLFSTPWIAAGQASLSITNSHSLLKLMSIKSIMPSNHLILCHPLLLPSIFPSIRVFSNESVLRIRWPKYWSFQ